MSNQNTIYLDHAATTPAREEVREAMAPFGSDVFGNPSSAHRWGRAAEAALEEARAVVATSLGARPSEIRFVRGGTESDNLAVLGTCKALGADGGLPTVIISTIEHSAVLEPAQHLSDIGAAKLVQLSVTSGGNIDVTKIEDALTDTSPSFTSVMWANNETGTLLPVGEVTATVQRHGGTMHSDAAQALGKVTVDVRDVPVDLLTATGHKLGGPKGMGLLFVRDGTPIRPLLYGGGQERALRPGTQDVAGAVGLATAVHLAVRDLAEEGTRLSSLRDTLEQALISTLPDLRVNGADGARAPHISSIGVGGVRDGAALLMAMDLEGLAVSGGSACHSGAGKSSHVIAALYGSDDAIPTIRFSFGKTTTHQDVDRAVSITIRVVQNLRKHG
jgi:cysteine desulfurase